MITQQAGEILTSVSSHAVNEFAGSAVGGKSRETTCSTWNQRALGGSRGRSETTISYEARVVGERE